MGIADDLEQLTNLVDRGLLSREEFESAKSRILRDVSPPIQSNTPTTSTSTESDAHGPAMQSTESPAGDEDLATTKPLIRRAWAIVLDNRGPSAAIAAIALIFSIGLFASADPEPAPSQPQAAAPSEAQVTRARCANNLVAWIDVYNADFYEVFATFGAQSEEGQTIAFLAQTFASRAYQVGADVAANEVRPQIVLACTDADFADRLARFPAR
jgi:hypothetical protein